MKFQGETIRFSDGFVRMDELCLVCGYVYATHLLSWCPDGWAYRHYFSISEYEYAFWTAQVRMAKARCL